MLSQYCVSSLCILYLYIDILVNIVLLARDGSREVESLGLRDDGSENLERTGKSVKSIQRNRVQ